MLGRCIKAEKKEKASLKKVSVICIMREELSYLKRRAGATDNVMYVNLVQNMHEDSEKVVAQSHELRALFFFLVMERKRERDEVSREAQWIMMFAGDIVSYGESRWKRI